MIIVFYLANMNGNNIGYGIFWNSESEFFLTDLDTIFRFMCKKHLYGQDLDSIIINIIVVIC